MNEQEKGTALLIMDMQNAMISGLAKVIITAE